MNTADGMKQSIEHKSLIAALYSAWDSFQVPAVAYHYLLSILSQKSKSQQSLIISRQIQLLKAGKDWYHTIIKWVNAREKALQIVKANIHLIEQADKDNQFFSQPGDLDDFESGYDVVFQSRKKDRKGGRGLSKLVNNLKFYQQATYAVVIKINEWQRELLQLGYRGLIQFLLNHQDYLQAMQEDTIELTGIYSEFFQNNLFFIFKKHHQSSEYALIYEHLKISSEFAGKIAEALQILDNHHSQTQRHRILGIMVQKGMASLKKIGSLKDIYYRGSREFIAESLRWKFQKQKNKVKYFPKYLSSVKSSKIDQTNQIVQQQKRTLATNNKIKKLQPIEHKYSYKDCSTIIKKGVETKVSFLLAPDGSRVIDRNYSKSTIILPSLGEIGEESAGTNRQSTKFQLLIQKDIYLTNLISYLQEEVLKRSKTGVQIQQLAKQIFKSKERITFAKVKVGELVVAWLAFQFTQTDSSFKRGIDIRAIYKFIKTVELEENIIEQYKAMGYGVVRMNGNIVYEQKLPQKMSSCLIKVTYLTEVKDRGMIGEAVRADTILKSSRVLKYYSYSKDSKYHKYCHHDQKGCSLMFEVKEVFRINIEGKKYLRARCDSIAKMGNIWKIDQGFNQLSLGIANSIQQLLRFSELIQEESVLSQDHLPQRYICLPEIKRIHRYIYDEKLVISEYLHVNDKVIEQTSLILRRQDVEDSLIVPHPFAAALFCNSKDDFGKIVALLNFD